MEKPISLNGVRMRVVSTVWRPHSSTSKETDAEQRRRAYSVIPRRVHLKVPAGHI